jgi:hypothetical protein
MHSLGNFHLDYGYDFEHRCLDYDVMVIVNRFQKFDWLSSFTTGGRAMSRNVALVIVGLIVILILAFYMQAVVVKQLQTNDELVNINSAPPANAGKSSNNPASKPTAIAPKKP